MAEKARGLKADRGGIFYYPYVETAAGKGKGLIRALSGLASVIVTDDYPTFFLPHMMESAATSSMLARNGRFEWSPSASRPRQSVSDGIFFSAFSPEESGATSCAAAEERFARAPGIASAEGLTS